MRYARMKRAIGLLLALATLTLALSPSPVRAQKKANYQAMVQEIGTYFNEALALYRKGDTEAAKLKAQSAYLEVFENLEGPIRINVSAKKNYQLEQEFIAIRKMIIAKEPAPEVEKRMSGFVADLKATVAKLEGGYELVAESSSDEKPQAPQPGRQAAAQAKEAAAPQPQGGAGIEPVWLKSFESIRTRLAAAAGVYRKGDARGAVELVVQTQFDDYKNSLLETAIRRHVSQKKNFQHNAGFSEIAGLMREGGDPQQVEERVAALVRGVEEDLPGLPLIDGAASGDAAGGARAAVPEKDWKAVNRELFAQVEKALELYGKGERRQAAAALQAAYFDVFEASGMEAQVGARDANFKSRLEGHFSLIASQMKIGAPLEQVRSSFATLKGDFEKGAALLGQGKDSPGTLFLYSLMIILREGIEAILIVTAIIAYLVKAGHRDKLRTIYSGCLSALLLSLVTAVLVKWVFKVSPASQEAMEGWTMLLASAVLFSVSYWLVSKAESRRWSAYLKEKVGDSLSASSLKTLWFAAFLAIYREGAETVLFYQALAADASGQGVGAVAGGFLTGSLLLVGVFLAMRHGALRLPIRPFFLVTGGLLYYMAFVFAGKGVMELIEGKLFEPSLVSWVPRVEALGLYPYVQTLAPQLLIVAAALVALGVLLRGRTAAGPGPGSAVTRG